MNAKVDEPARWLPPERDSREIEPDDNHDAQRHDRELAKRRRGRPGPEGAEPLAAEMVEDRED
jgi:hypothetical protein